MEGREGFETVTVELPAWMHDELSKHAEKAGVSLEDFIRVLVYERLAGF